MEINAIGNEDKEDDYTTEEEVFYESESESSDYTSTASGDIEDINLLSDSDDSVYDYPYNLNEIKRSTPLKALTTIKGKVISTVFDSGASLSLISRALAKELKLLPNGDTIPIVSVDHKRNGNVKMDPRKRSDITVDVPVHVLGVNYVQNTW
jgi:hypothetical protein